MANYDASTIIKAAYAQVTGASAIDDLNVEEIIDAGKDSSLFNTQREPFTKALIEQCAKFFFTDESYTNNYEDPFFTDARRFASVLQVISVEAPEVKDNPAWRALTSGSSTVGSYTITLPSISSKVFASTDSYSIEVCISNEQWDDAVRSADELQQLVDYIFMSINNAVLQHKEDLLSLQRAKFMALKIQAQADVSNTGVHVIELRSAYNAARGKSIATKEAFLADADAMRWASKTIMLYADYIKKQSVLFNVPGKVKFVPNDRLVLEINTGFERSLEEVALSTTFHDDLVRMTNYHTVPYWQAPKDADSTLDFTATTSIDVKLDKDTEISQSGIVAFMCDKMGLMHCIRSERVGSQYFDIDALTLYSFQHRDSYMCNTDLPAIVFTLEDPSN